MPKLLEVLEVALLILVFAIYLVNGHRKKHTKVPAQCLTILNCETQKKRGMAKQELAKPASMGLNREEMILQMMSAEQIAML